MKIEHVAIWTGQLEVMREFYCRYFGARSNEKYINKLKGFESYFLSFKSGARLELMQMEGSPENRNELPGQYLGLIHLAISVGSEQAVLDKTDELRSAGYRVEGEPRRTGDGYFESTVLDPDFNRIEITV